MTAALYDFGMKSVLDGAGCAVKLTILNFRRGAMRHPPAGAGYSVGTGLGSHGDSFFGAKCDKIQRFSDGPPAIRLSRQLR